MQSEYDVIIVGARIAGSIVAALVGAAGYRVLLVDRATFPSPTLSTHFFRGEFTLTTFKRLGILDEVLSLGSPKLLYQYVYLDGSANYEKEPPQSPGDIGYCLSVRRETLDHVLVLRACRSKSVHLLENTSVYDVLWQDNCVIGVRLKVGTEAHDVKAKIIIGADGRNSVIAAKVKPSVEDSVSGFRATYYQYMRDFPRLNNAPIDGVEFSTLGDEIAYLFPSDDDVTCLALSVNLSTYANFKGQHKTQFYERMSYHKGFANRAMAAKPVGKLFSHAPHPNFIRVPVGKGWALVGDAGQYQDPWSGFGMDSASITATFLSEALLQWFAGEADETDALTQYHQRRNEVCVPFFNLTVEQARSLTKTEN